MNDVNNNRHSISNKENKIKIDSNQINNKTINLRKDKFGNNITKKNKIQKISFVDQIEKDKKVAEVKLVESYKKYNKLTNDDDKPCI